MTTLEYRSAPLSSTSRNRYVLVPGSILGSEKEYEVVLPLLIPITTAMESKPPSVPARSTTNHLLLVSFSITQPRSATAPCTEPVKLIIREGVVAADSAS